MKECEIMWRLRREVQATVHEMSRSLQEGQEKKFFLGRNTYFCINVFKKKVFVHIRDYEESWDNPGETRPTLNGISMKGSEFRSFCRVLEEMRKYMPVTKLLNDEIMIDVIKYLLIKKATAKLGEEPEPTKEAIKAYVAENFHHLFAQLDDKEVEKVYEDGLVKLNKETDTFVDDPLTMATIIHVYYNYIDEVKEKIANDEFDSEYAIMFN